MSPSNSTAQGFIDTVIFLQVRLDRKRNTWRYAGFIRPTKRWNWLIINRKKRFVLQTLRTIWLAVRSHAPPLSVWSRFRVAAAPPPHASGAQLLRQAASERTPHGTGQGWVFAFSSREEAACVRGSGTNLGGYGRVGICGARPSFQLFKERGRFIKLALAPGEAVRLFLTVYEHKLFYFFVKFFCVVEVHIGCPTRSSFEHYVRPV